MKKGKLDNARRRALNLFDEWNKITGFVVEHTGYYYELQSLIEDAVDCGAQAALGVYEPLECEEVTKDDSGENEPDYIPYAARVFY